MTAPPAAAVTVVTPWYPTRAQPFRGSFVQAAVAATRPVWTEMTVYHCDDWVHWLPRREAAAVDRAYPALVPRGVRARPDVEGADLMYLPVVARGGLDYAAIAQRHADALRTVLSGQPLPTAVVHAHVGLPSGWAAVRNAAPHARVFVTEHASFLPRLLAQPAARARYDELLAACTGFFAVGDGVRRRLVAAFPHHADRIKVASNPVSFDTRRDAAVTELRRWIFVGSLKPAKGVHWLVEAFARCRVEDDRLSLTIVGDGPQRDELIAKVGELGLTGAVTFTGALPPEAAQALLRRHDLLVHPSRQETFGLTVVEAIAAGLPVLVTRCGGPEETLAGVEAAAGELVAVEEGSDELVRGYARLRARWPAGLDLEHARQVLAGRFGYQAFAEAHRRAWFPAEVASHG